MNTHIPYVRWLAMPLCLSLLISGAQACISPQEEGQAPGGGPPGAVQIEFTASRTRLQRGECATLHWEVQGGFSVQFDGQEVEHSGQREVCPQDSTTYTLSVDAGDSLERRQIALSVQGPRQPTPPSPTLRPQSTSAPTSPPPTHTPSATPTPAATAIDCPVLPTGSFLTIWQSSPELQNALGCPVSYHPRVTPTAWEVTTSYQPFERGTMIWSDHTGWYPQPVVYVLHADSTYQRFADTFDAEVDPIAGGESAPNGLVEPLYGFGKVWRGEPGVRESLGWATASETPGTGRFEMFSSGDMIWISQTNRTYVFSGSVVRVFDIPFSEE